MAHVAPAHRRRRARAPRHIQAPAPRRIDQPDGPVLAATWLGLTFGLLLGVVLLARSHVGVRAAGITLLMELVPLTVAVFGSGLRRGIGSAYAATSTGAAFTLVLLRLTVLS